MYCQQHQLIILFFCSIFRTDICQHIDLVLAGLGIEPARTIDHAGHRLAQGLRLAEFGRCSLTPEEVDHVIALAQKLINE